MSSQVRVKRLWIAGSVSLVVGLSLVLGWLCTRERLPVGTIVVPRDAATLAAAIQLALPGGVIALDARRGPFEGGVLVNVKGLTILSRGGRATLSGFASPLLTIVADDVTIEDLGFAGPGIGVEVEGSGCRIANATFSGLDTAVRLSGGVQDTLEDLVIRGGKVGVDVAAQSTHLSGLSCRDVAEIAIRVRGVAGCELENLVIESCTVGLRLEDVSDTCLVRSVVRRAATAIEASGGGDLAIERSSVLESRLGISLRDTEGATIAACTISDTAEAGVALEDAHRARVIGNVFDACKVAIRGVGSGERALCDNTFAESSDAAIDLRGGDDDLVSGNAIQGGDIGISVSRSTGGQLLRNVVNDAFLVGVLLDGVSRTQVLDTKLVDCAVGIAVVASSEVVVQRCEARDSSAVGIALVNGTLGNFVGDNSVCGSTEGILVAGASRDVVIGNSVARCATGLALRRLGYGVHVHENDVSDCDVGLAWTDAAWDGTTLLEKLGIRLDRALSAAAPLVTGNTFDGSRAVDARNETSTPLLAGGNRWSDAPARVEGGVLVPDSRWTLTLGLGAAASTTDLVLGHLLQWLLLDLGARVVDLIGLGAPAEVADAFRRGDLNIAWCDPVTAEACGVQFWPTSVERGFAFVAAPSITSGEDVSVALPPGVDEAAVARILAVHDLVARSIQKVLSAGEAESLLKFGAVDCAVVDRLEETVTLAGFVQLDDVGALPAWPAGLGLGPLDAGGASTVHAAFDRLKARLSEEALRNLVSRVRLLRRDPADVTMEYLLREGLIGGSTEGEAR